MCELPGSCPTKQLKAKISHPSEVKLASPI